MRALFTLALVLLTPIAGAQSLTTYRPDLALEPRHALEGGAFGGAAEIADLGDWGHVSYAIAGLTMRYEYANGNRRFGFSVSSSLGARYALDELSFERFGWVAERYAITYLGGIAGIETRRFGAGGTFGLVVGSTLARTHAPAVSGSASLTARAGRVDRLAVVMRLGSTDGWASDRTLWGLGLLHDGTRFRMLVSGFAGATMAPRLLPSKEYDPGIRPGFRVPIYFVIPSSDFGVRVELGVRIRATFLGTEISFGQQLPVGRIFVRTEIAARRRR